VFGQADTHRFVEIAVDWGVLVSRRKRCDWLSAPPPLAADGLLQAYNLLGNSFSEFIVVFQGDVAVRPPIAKHDISTQSFPLLARCITVIGVNADLGEESLKKPFRLPGGASGLGILAGRRLVD